MPAPHFLLAAFISHHVGQVGSQGLARCERLLWYSEDRWVEQTANKQGTTFRHEQRGLVTKEHMLALFTALDTTRPFHAAAWSLATTAFAGC
jgi:hypothetical protein